MLPNEFFLHHLDQEIQCFHFFQEILDLLIPSFPVHLHLAEIQNQSHGSLFDIDSQNRGVEIYNNSKLRTPNSYFILNNCGRPSGFGIEPINDFIYCLQNDLPFIADGNDGLQAELIAEEVHESLEKGEAEKLKRD